MELNEVPERFKKNAEALLSLGCPPEFLQNHVEQWLKQEEVAARIPSILAEVNGLIAELPDTPPERIRRVVPGEIHRECRGGIPFGLFDDDDDVTVVVENRPITPDLPNYETVIGDYIAPWLEKAGVRFRQELFDLPGDEGEQLARALRTLAKRQLAAEWREVVFVPEPVPGAKDVEVVLYESKRPAGGPGTPAEEG